MKKTINIVLITVVLGLWGTLIYKTVNQYFFSKKVEIDKNQFGEKFNMSQIYKDTFNLEDINRDPFLNKQNEASTITVSKPIKNYSKSPKPIPIIKPKEIVNWPSIFYYGYIKSKFKTEELILVKINNKLYKLRKNDDVDGLSVKKFYNDSIEVNYNKEKKIITIN